MAEELLAIQFMKDLGDALSALETLGPSANVMFPFIVASLVGVRTRFARDNKSLSAERKAQITEAWQEAGLGITAAWGLVNSESVAAEAGCLIALGISPWATEITESVTTWIDELKKHYAKVTENDAKIWGFITGDPKAFKG